MYEMDLLLDINSDLYPIEVSHVHSHPISATAQNPKPQDGLTQVQDKFTLALSTTLNKDNQDSADHFDKVGHGSQMPVAVLHVNDL